MDMKLVHNKGALQNSHAQRAALPDTIYSCLASNGMKYIGNVRKSPPPRSEIPEPVLPHRPSIQVIVVCVLV